MNMKVMWWLWPVGHGCQNWQRWPELQFPYAGKGYSFTYDNPLKN